jgi:hypothetical protein
MIRIEEKFPSDRVDLPFRDNRPDDHPAFCTGVDGKVILVEEEIFGWAIRRSKGAVCLQKIKMFIHQSDG